MYSGVQVRGIADAAMKAIRFVNLRILTTDLERSRTPDPAWPERPMPESDYDLFVCPAGPSARDLARSVAAALASRGFHAFLAGQEAGPEANERRLRLIEEVADFVLVFGTDAPNRPAGADAARDEVTRALRANRNIVLVFAASGERPPDLAPGLSRCPVVRYDPARAAESVAILAHHLSSDGTVDDRRLMRRAKRLFWAAALILVAGIAIQEIPALLERWSRPTLLDPIPPFALHWSGIAQRSVADQWRAFPIAADTDVVSGDQVRLVFSTSADGFAYVVSRDARGRVSMLFPTDAVRGASQVKAGEQYIAPVGNGWLRVDDQGGVETIFIIAGYDPLQNLEELLEEPEATTTLAARRGLLETTVEGLLDGRHGAAERRVWTGKLHPIDRALHVPPGPLKSSVSLPGGAVVDCPFVTQPGLISASIELRLHQR